MSKKTKPVLTGGSMKVFAENYLAVVEAIRKTSSTCAEASAACRDFMDAFQASLREEASS